MKVFKWQCPKCKTGELGTGHGKGGHTVCIYDKYENGACGGFACECYDKRDLSYRLEDHGLTKKNPCRNATCYHCGWTGCYPKVKIEDE